MDFDKKNNLYRMIMAVVITALITFLVTTVGLYNYFTRTKEGSSKAITKYIETVGATTDIETRIEIVKACLEERYIGELNEEQMLESAVSGYVEGLGDEYTEYMTKDEFEELMISVNGNYVGIGIYMTKDIEDNVIILMPIEGSPAEEAGLKTGDIILTVDGEDCTAMDLNSVSNKIKGEEGTTVKLEVLKAEDNKTVELNVERKKVEIKYIQSEMLENNIGYIELLSFDEGATEKFKTELENLKANNIKSLIIDLRDNGGGLVEEAIALSELFVPEGNVIMRSYNKAEEETVIESTNKNPEDIEIILLVNENSASASEIFAAALQDNDLATIVGETTYGKGVMQEVIPFSNGGALKVTIEEFKTPNGDKIHEVGILPDVEVKLDNNSEKDVQLEKAIELLK